MENTQAVELILARNAFYRRLYLWALAALGLAWLLIVLLGLMLGYIVKNPTHPIYFATDEVSRLVNVVPVSQPNMTLDEVSAWAVEAAEAAYSYDFVNYRAELQNAQKYFTSAGWREYIRALEASNNLAAMTTRKLIVSAHVIDKPKLIRQGVLQSGGFAGHVAYRFEMPLLVTYWRPPYNAKSKFSNALTVNVALVRQPILQSYKGLGVLQLVASAASGEEAGISSQPTG